MNDRQKDRLGHLTALITITIWGATFISTKILLVDFTPVEILFCRFLLGFAALIAAFPHRLKNTGLRRELTFAAAGLCGITLYYLLENIALTFTQASNVGVIVSAAPFFTALLSRIFFPSEEHLHKSFFFRIFHRYGGNHTDQLQRYQTPSESERRPSRRHSSRSVGFLLRSDEKNQLLRISHRTDDTEDLRLWHTFHGSRSVPLRFLSGFLTVCISAQSAPHAFSRARCISPLLCDVEPRRKSSGRRANQRIHLYGSSYHSTPIRHRPG